MKNRCFYRILRVNRGGFCAFLSGSLVVIVSCLWPAIPALAMGLGDIRSSSPLGSPLKATIAVTSDFEQYGVSELRVRQLNPKQAKSLGIELAGAYKSYVLALTEIDGKLVIELSSRKPVNEPFLNFLVELTWVTGKVYREYTLLLDPVISVSSPVSTNERKQSRVVAVPQQDMSLSPGDESYRVRSGDNLSKIAARLVEGSTTSRRNMMQWLVQNNPQAFINGDMNRLKSGATLSLPAGDGVNPANLSKPSRRAAPADLVAVDKPSNAAGIDVGPADAPAASQDDEVERLSIVTAGDGKQRAGVDPEAQRVIELQAQVVATNDVIERLRRENQAMRERMVALEKSDYVKSLERLVLLKEEEVHELRVRMDDRAEAQETEIAKVQEEQTKPAKQSAVVTGSSQRWWMLVLLVLALAGAIYFFYRWRNREALKNADSDDSGPDDKGLLEELDKIIASRAVVGNVTAKGSAPRVRATDKMSADPFDAFTQAGRSGIGSTAGADNQAGPRRSDATVKKSILEKTAAYSPPEMEEFDLELPEENLVDDVISDAIAAASRGDFDIAEALLRAEQAEQASNDGPGDAQIDSRLGVTLQYIAKLREAEGNR